MKERGDCDGDTDDVKKELQAERAAWAESAKTSTEWSGKQEEEMVRLRAQMKTEYATLANQVKKLEKQLEEKQAAYAEVAKQLTQSVTSFADSVGGQMQEQV
jgi:predicted nuclease with TOPRIM domain